MTEGHIEGLTCKQGHVVLGLLIPLVSPVPLWVQIRPSENVVLGIPETGGLVGKWLDLGPLRQGWLPDRLTCLAGTR